MQCFREVYRGISHESLVFSSGEWDILWYTTRKPCITMLYHFIENTWSFKSMRCMTGRLGVIPLNCTDRWEGLVEYRRIYNGFPAFCLPVFSMAWYEIQYNVCVFNQKRIKTGFY